MKTFDFFAVPRAIGNPLQHIAKSEKEIFDFIDTNMGKAPIFISHNSYPTFIKNKNNTDEIYQVSVSKLFLDFDSERKPENAQLDALKVIEFCEKENLPFLVAFSGSKGFHVYIALRQNNYIYGKFLKDATRAIHIWLQKKLELRTIDMQCAEPRRLCRVMYTKHVKRDKKSGSLVANGMYCCPMLPEWIRDWRIDDIMAYARSPSDIVYEPHGDLLTIDEFLTRFGIDIEEMLRSAVAKSGDFKGSLCEYKPVTDDFIKQILPQPCIHGTIMNNPNPPHMARFAAVTWLNEIRYPKKWIYDFFYARNYIDRDASVIAYQINNIVDKGYKTPTCESLYKEGLCVGDVCPNFNSLVRRLKINDENSKQCGDAGVYEGQKAAC
jgi:hypothetical protein